MALSKLELIVSDPNLRPHKASEMTRTLHLKGSFSGITEVCFRRFPFLGGLKGKPQGKPNPVPLQRRPGSLTRQAMPGWLQVSPASPVAGFGPRSTDQNIHIYIYIYLKQKDAALNSRVQLIRVSESSEKQAISIAKDVAQLLEKHHGVQILDSAIEAVVKLYVRYMSHLRLPDKTINIIR